MSKRQTNQEIQGKRRGMAIIAQGTPGHDQEPLLTPGISIPID